MGEREFMGVEYISRTALSEQLGVCTATIWRAEKSQGLPRIKMGNQAWYRKDAVREWLQRRESVAA